MLSLLLLADKDGVPDMVLKLAIWAGQAFEFFMLRDPSEATMEALAVPKLPTIIAMSPTKLESGSIAFGPQPFNRKHFGGECVCVCVRMSE